MKAIVVMFDSLNRRHLPPYGCDWTQAPNFARLAQRTATFDRSYVCSMPCMPARRDFLTGRPNFLHRSWGPLEPFDDSLPVLLRKAGVSSHLVSDHQHYWEPGGATYHTQYDTWQFFRGQEGDPFIGQIADPPTEGRAGRNAGKAPMERQDRVNRQFIRHEHQWPQAQTFAAGLDFIRRNHQDDNWFLQIETFDPHEPFNSPRSQKDRYAEHYADYKGPVHDWPPYRGVEESPEAVEHMRYEYASLLSLCDTKLGDVLDAMDQYDLWDDTLLIVWTDHGFLLGEHDMWAKVWCPFYDEIAHTPFFVWDPRCKVAGERRQALVQPSIDLAPTLLRYFGAEPTADMRGQDLAQSIARDQPVREAAIFGQHGHQINVTDGRYVYMRGPAASNQPLFEYTLMPTHMRGFFTVDELAGKIELADGFPFTKGCRVLQIPARGNPNAVKFGTMLFDLEADPKQERPLADAAVERRMTELLTARMRECDAPAEQYTRLGVPGS